MMIELRTGAVIENVLIIGAAFNEGGIQLHVTGDTLSEDRTREDVEEWMDQDMFKAIHFDRDTLDF